MDLRAIVIVLISYIAILFSFRKAIYGLYGYLWFAYFRAQDITSWVTWLPKLRLSFILAVSVIINAILQKEKVFYPHRLTYLILLLWLFFLASAVFSSVPYVSWKYFWDMTKVFIMGSLISGLANTQEKLHRICLVIAICLGFFGVKVGIFTLTGGQVMEGPGGIMADNNTYAMVLVMTIPFLYYLGHTYQGWLKRCLHYAIPFVMWGVVGTRSRGGFLALLALLIIMTVYTGGKLRRFISVLFLFAICSWPFLPQDYKMRVGTIPKPTQISQTEIIDGGPTTDKSIGGRLHFWKVAWIMAEQNPISGTGIGTFIARYNDYDFSRGFYGENRAVHNSYLEILSNNGFMTLGLYLMLFIVAFLENRKIRRLARKNNSAFAWAVPYTYMIEMSILAFLVGSNFLSVAYADLPYHILFLVVALRHVIQVELRAAAN